MCGIVGEYYFKNKCIDYDHNIELLIDKIKSRGPDFSGFSVLENICLGPVSYTHLRAHDTLR